MRRGVHRGIAAVIAAAAAAWTAAAVGLAAPARADVAVLHLDGRGFGHGVGLAQWGARYAADAGADAASILATFYPGTSFGQAAGVVGGSGTNVRVAVHAGPEATIAFPQGGEIRSPLVGDQAEGFPIMVAPGGMVSIRPDGGGFVVDAVVVAQSVGAPVQSCIPVLGPCPVPTTTPPTTAPPATTAPGPAPAPTDQPGGEPPPGDPGSAPPETAPAEAPPPAASSARSTGPVFAVPAGDGVTEVTARGRRYRGLVEAVGDPAGLRLVNQLDVESYLKGMAEVPATWPAAAQEAQAIAARTYVLRAMAASGEVCDHERCQVYVGATREAPGQNAAVDATRGLVLTYGGALASTVYSADAGGITATPAEGFGAGGGDYPYLTNVRYDTPDPLPWVTDVALTDVAARFGYPGTVTGVRIVEAGPSGRAMVVALDGSAGERLVDGQTFARRLGLRSTLFTPSIGSAAAAPAAPPESGLEEPMALPDDVAAMTAAIGRTAAAADSREPGEASVLPGALDGTPVAERPATLLALAAVGGATAYAMAHAGGIEGALALVARTPRRRGTPSSRSWRSC